MTISSVAVCCSFFVQSLVHVFVCLLLQPPIASDSNQQAPAHLLILLISQSPVRLLILLMSHGPARPLIDLISQAPARLLIHLMSKSPVHPLIHPIPSSIRQKAIHVQVWGSFPRPVINHKTMSNTIVSINTH